MMKLIRIAYLRFLERNWGVTTPEHGQERDHHRQLEDHPEGQRELDDEVDVARDR